MTTAGKSELPNPKEKLVKVFDSDLESEVMIVRGLLESAGIDAITSSLDAQQDILPGVGGVIIRVREEQAGAARQLIKDYASGGANAAEEAESESEAEARAKAQE
ncbi:MAG: hypothetical protein ABSD20_06605 [Terriglobales bacterium]|jgi:hypothetical protein